MATVVTQELNTGFLFASVLFSLCVSVCVHVSGKVGFLAQFHAEATNLYYFSVLVAFRCALRLAHNRAHSVTLYSFAFLSRCLQPFSADIHQRPSNMWPLVFAENTVARRRLCGLTDRVRRGRMRKISPEKLQETLG